MAMIKKKKPARPLTPEHYLIGVPVLIQTQRIDAISQRLFDLKKEFDDLQIVLEASDSEMSQKVDELDSEVSSSQANLTLSLAKLKSELVTLINSTINSTKASLDKTVDIKDLKYSLSELLSKFGALTKSLSNIESEIHTIRSQDDSASKVNYLTDRVSLLQKGIDLLNIDIKKPRKISTDEMMRLISQIKFPVPTVQRSLSIPVAVDEGGTGLTNNNYFYFGGSPSAPASGMWRFSVSGTDLIAERYETGAWVQKGGFTA